MGLNPYAEPNGLLSRQVLTLANQLLEDANFTYQYDNNGNLTLKTPKTSGPFTSYEYNAENKLVRVVTNGTTVNYKYDGLGRRVEKEVNDVRFQRRDPGVFNLGIHLGRSEATRAFSTLTLRCFSIPFSL